MRIKRFFGAAGIAGQPSGSNQLYRYLPVAGLTALAKKKKLHFVFPKMQLFRSPIKGPIHHPKSPQDFSCVSL